MVLETERLELREWTMEDLPVAIPLFADPQTMRYIGEGKPRSVEQVEQTLQNCTNSYAQFGYGLWKVLFKPTGELVGHCGLKYWDEFDRVEVGYLVTRPYWGRGIAFEAARASIAFGFEQKALPEIIALIDRPNLASSNVARKLGMTFEQEIDFGYKWTDCFRIGREEFLGRKASQG